MVLGGAALAACADDSADLDTGAGPGDAAADAVVDAGNDTSDVSDAASAEVTPDAAQPDTATDADDDRDAAADTDTGEVSEPVVSAITKGPWMVTSDAGAIALLAETTGGAALTLQWRSGPDAEWRDVVADQVTEEIGFRFPPTDALLTEYPDLPGTYTLHRAELSGAPPGAACEWRALEGGTVTANGTFTAGAAAGSGFRFAWIADTMAPGSGPVARVLEGETFDLMLHGGDIQYRSGLVDTWNGMFRTFAGTFRRAPVHFAIGNHEFEDGDQSGDTTDVEYDGTFRRLFARQGDAGSTTEYYAFTWGHVRFVMLNSEDPEFVVDGAQLRWLRAELEATRTSSTLRYAVVGFHRPYYTFGNSGPNLVNRAVLHPLMVEFGVPLVLTGHNHSYERFEVDGVHYVVDGGGGAIQGNPSVWVAHADETRPGETALRKAVTNTHGASFFAVAADGSIEGWRTNTRGVEEDRYRIVVG